MSATITPGPAATADEGSTRSRTHGASSGCLLFGFPFYWLLSTSVKEQDEMFGSPGLGPCVAAGG